MVRKSIRLSLSVFESDFVFFSSDGGAGDVVPGSHGLDWELSGSGSLGRPNWTPSIRCLERRQEVGDTIRRGFRDRKRPNKCNPVRSHTWRPSEAAQRLLQGIHSVAVSNNHWIDIRCIPCSPTYAGCQFSPSLVGKDPTLYLMRDNSEPNLFAPACSRFMKYVSSFSKVPRKEKELMCIDRL